MKTSVLKMITITSPKFSGLRFTKRGIAAVLLLTLLASQKTLADTFYVGTAGTPSGNYYTDIQSAVDAASAGDLVLVSNGVYATGERVTPGYALSNRVVITKNITVRSVSGPATTIILGKEAPGGGVGAGAVRCVFMEDGMLEGFTISNGHTMTTGNNIHNKSGGGIWLTNGCVVSNCTISGNSASYSGGGTHCGCGGSVSDCTISGNCSGKFAGGASCSKGGALSRCTINGNIAGFSGGGVRCSEGDVVYDCEISGNSAIHGGGSACYDGSKLNNCTIIGNTSQHDGGGVLCGNSEVNNCTIMDNEAMANGGGAYINSGGVMNNCIISGNSAGDYGGGVACNNGGALTNCLVYGMNSAAYGGGLSCRGGGDANNCTITGNIADYGGGAYCTNGGTLINAILYSNQSIQDGDNWFAYVSGVTFSYCCTFPTNGLPGGNGCIPDNPMFLAPGSDYHLTGASPCVDAGITMPWMTGATDLDGNPRIYNGAVDIGAYECLGAKIPVTSPNWKLKNKKKGVLKGKPISPLLCSFLTNGYGVGIWNLETDSNVDGPRQLTAKNKKKTVCIFKDKTDKTAKIIYSEKYKKKKDIYKTKLKYVFRGQIPVSNLVYVAPND